MFILSAVIDSNAQFNRNNIEESFLKSGYIGLTAGVGLPLGDFENSDFNNIRSGYAKTGYAINGTLKFAFTPYFGIALGYSYFNNALNYSKLERDINDSMAKTGSGTTVFKANAWELSGVYLMPVYIFSASNMNIDIGIGGGIFSGTLPATSNSVSYPVPVNGYTNASFIQAESSASNWALTGTIGIRYKLIRDFILSFHADYIYTDITFKDLSQEVTIRGTNQTLKGILFLDDYKQPFRILSISAGIGYQFE